jgi:DNA-directed RNA polymerase specialized sigma24 family protein
MSSDGSITRWLAPLKAGDHDAAHALWGRYFSLLVARARSALRSAPRRAADEEDVALSAFDSFCRGAEQGRFPRLDDRNDLWRLLLTLTARKAWHLARDEKRSRRGGGKVLGEGDLAALGERDSDEAALARFAGAEPTPELAAEVAEECGRLLEKLGDDELRSIAVLQLEGYTVDEIAARLGRSPRTAARKLAVIRDLWREEGRAS